MNIRKSFIILFLISFILILLSCDKMENADHPGVTQLAEDIQKIENVEKAYGKFRAFDLIIEVFVTDDFEVKTNREKILDLAKKYLDTEAMNEMRERQGYEYPLDAVIYIRNKEGKILFDISASRYASYERSKLPDYDEYVWRLSEWE